MMLKTKGGVLLGPDKFENDCQERPAYKWGKLQPTIDARMAEMKKIADAAGARKAKEAAK
jgi:hypothetical protein